MWAHEIPADVATEIYGTVACVLADYLRTAIQYVEAASRINAQQLLDRYRSR